MRALPRVATAATEAELLDFARAGTGPVDYNHAVQYLRGLEAAAG